MNGRLIQKSTGLKQIKILSKFLISLSKMHTSPPEKKIIKFTQISRTVWTFAKKTEITQNTENFHPCRKIFHLNLIFDKNIPNLDNQYKSTERKISQKNK